MNKEEHLKRHKELHECLDELFADYIRHHPSETKFLDVPLERLIEWSYQQTIKPEEEE